MLLLLTKKRLSTRSGVVLFSICYGKEESEENFGEILNSNQETRVMTEFGLTDTIVIEDSIRQGRSLSGPEFGLLIDKLNVELRTTDLGVQYSFIILICLLFMDDIALLARSAKEVQEKLNNQFISK